MGVNFKDRPEDPELDRQQMGELYNHLASLSRKALLRTRKQLLRDAENDQGLYGSGGVPANVNKTLIMINTLLEG